MEFKKQQFNKKIESIGTKFGDVYNTSSGIATLKNKVYIFKPCKKDEDYFYMQDDTKIEKIYVETSSIQTN